MLNLARVSVISESDLKMFIENGDCTCFEDVDFEISQEYEYAVLALVDLDKKNVIYKNDNVHGNPKTFIEGFIKALEYNNIEYTIKDIVMMKKTLEEYNYIFPICLLECYLCLNLQKT